MIKTLSAALALLGTTALAPALAADEEAAQDDALSARQEADKHQGGVAPLTRADLIPGIVVIVI